MCHQPHWLAEGLDYKNTVKGVLMVRRQSLYGKGMLHARSKQPQPHSRVVPKGGLGSAPDGREPSDPIRKRVIGPGAGGNTGTSEWRCYGSGFAIG